MVSNVVQATSVDCKQCGWLFSTPRTRMAHCSLSSSFQACNFHALKRQQFSSQAGICSTWAMLKAYGAAVHCPYLWHNSKGLWTQQGQHTTDAHRVLRSFCFFQRAKGEQNKHCVALPRTPGASQRGPCSPSQRPRQRGPCDTCLRSTSACCSSSCRGSGRGRYQSPSPQQTHTRCGIHGVPAIGRSRR
jgi:hypothetical protein